MNQYSLFSKMAWYFNIRKKKQEIVEALEELGILNKSMSVLDIGGGTGKILSWIAPRVKRAVVLDPSPGMIAECTKRGIECVLGRAEQIPFPNASFDLVMMHDVFHHIGDKEQAIRETYRALAPQGSVVVAEFNPKTLRGWGVVVFEKILRLGSQFFTPKEFTELWQKYNFSGTTLKTYSGSYIMQFRKNPISNSRARPSEALAEEGISE
ncbi:MAG: class I SAM-dependent methyltransferase [Patescibacteria group bacterium]